MDIHQIMKHYDWRIYMIVGIFAWVCVSPPAHASIIYPGDPNWQPDLNPIEKQVNNVPGQGYAYISGSKPQSGNASLALGTTGLLSDWAFYNRYAGDGQPGSPSWGFLSNVDRLSFDWYRQTITSGDVPWQAQTPVLRLYVSDTLNGTNVLSELVWEQYYTDSSPAVNNQWVPQDVMGQNLWRHVFGVGYTTVANGTIDPFSPHPLLTATVSSWSQITSIYYSPDAVVYGIGVGVGNYWPHQYVGYVDNVMLAFQGQNGPVVVVNDNFELPIPEPSSLVLVLCGLAFLFAGGFIRRRRES